MPRGPSWLHVLADTLAVLAGFALAWALRFGSGLLSAPLGAIPFAEWIALAALSLPVWLLIFALHGLYYTRLKQSFAAEAGSLAHAVAEEVSSFWAHRSTSIGWPLMPPSSSLA